MINLENSASEMRPVKTEPIVNEDEDVLCGEVNECMMMDAQQTDTPIDSDEANPSDMQPIFSAASANDGDDWDINMDRRYMLLLDSFREDGNSHLRDNPLRCIRYDVDNGGYDKREFRGVTDKKKRSRDDGNTIRVTKKNVESKARRHVSRSTEKTRKESVDMDLRRRERSIVTDDKSVHVRRNSQHNVEDARKKENTEEEEVVVLDENYRSYLTWLVEKSRIPRANPETEIQVKREEDDAMSLSGSDIIAVGDRPFLDEEESPFVPSKNDKVVDVEEERGDQPNSWFKKEIMNLLKQPYNKEEYDELYNEASVGRMLTRHWELRDGRDIDGKTDQEGPSYLDMYPGFKRKFEELHESLREEDRRRALNLLRGFIFYLTKVARHDAFKPWRDRECLKIRCL